MPEDKKRTKVEYDDESKEKSFQIFFKTLPTNLRVDSPDYNIRGFWESLGEPKIFDSRKMRKDADGFFHAFSRNAETGEILKSPQHKTFKMAIEGDRTAGYYPIVTPGGIVKTVSASEVMQQEENIKSAKSVADKTSYGKFRKLGTRK
jgi:hypothetical protein